MEGTEVIEVGDEDVDGGGDDDSYLQFFLLVEFLLNLTICYIYITLCAFTSSVKKLILLFSTEEGTEYIR